MPRPRGDGIKIVRRTLADGTVREHRYLRQRPGEPRRQPETLAEAITAYLDTPAYKARKPRTRDLYRSYLDQIRGRLGATRLDMIRPSMVRAVLLDLQATPSKANMWLSMLSIVLQHATELDLITTNPCRGIKRLPAAKRTEIWSHEEESRAFAAMPQAVQLALMLMLYTCQRLSDVLAMTTTRVAERNGRLYVGLRQQKTGALLDVPVHAALEPLLRARLMQRVPCRKTGESLLLVPSPTGITWSRRNFSRTWDTCLAKIGGGGGLQRRDLRRTGIVRLAEAGATTPQIAAISGHQIDYCQGIIDTYLPRRTEVAIGGIELWERAIGKKIVKIRP